MNEEIYCNNHLNEFITNFCLLKDCMKPLCAECINDHNKFHENNNNNDYYGEYETFKEVKFKCYSKLNLIIKKLNNELIKLDKIEKISYLDNINELIENLNDVKKQIVKQMNKYFNNIINDFELKIINSKKYCLKPIKNELYNLLFELKELKLNLNTNYVIPNIKKIIKINKNKIINNIQIKVKNNLKNKLNIPNKIEIYDMEILKLNDFYNNIIFMKYDNNNNCDINYKENDIIN